MEIKISSITINTPHLEPMRAFYEELGVQFTQVAVDKGSQIVKGDMGGIEIALMSAPNLATSLFPRLQICFQLKNLDELVKKIQARSQAQVMMDPMDFPDGRRAIVIDPDGNSVELWEKK